MSPKTIPEGVLAVETFLSPLFGGKKGWEMFSYFRGNTTIRHQMLSALCPKLKKKSSSTTMIGHIQEKYANKTSFKTGTSRGRSQPITYRCSKVYLPPCDFYRG